jgi:hypothetical protein
MLGIGRFVDCVRLCQRQTDKYFTIYDDSCSLVTHRKKSISVIGMVLSEEDDLGCRRFGRLDLSGFNGIHVAVLDEITETLPVLSLIISNHPKDVIQGL